MKSNLGEYMATLLKIEPDVAEELADTLRVEMRVQIELEKHNLSTHGSSIVNEPTAAPEPPAFAVGTRVRISKRHHLRPGGKGTVIELRPEIGAVDVELDDTETNLLFPVGRLEPLPATAPALPEGVTRLEKTEPRRVIYRIEREEKPETFLGFAHGSDQVRVERSFDVMMWSLDDFKTFIAAGQALIAELEAQS